MNDCPTEAYEFKLASDDPPVMLAKITSGSTRFVLYAKDGEAIVTIGADGSVEVDPKYTTDEAARAFWFAVQRIFAGARI